MNAHCENCYELNHLDENGLCVQCSAARHADRATARWARRCETCGQPCHIIDEHGRCITCSPTAAPAEPRRRELPRCEGCGTTAKLGADGVCADCAATAIYRTLNGAARALHWIARHRP